MNESVYTDIRTFSYVMHFFFKCHDRVNGIYLCSFSDGNSALLCSAKSQKSNCWDGRTSKSEDESEFPTSDIKGQGMACGSFFLHCKVFYIYMLIECTL